SDIHGNLPALRVALAMLRRQGTDALLCAGDIIGYGPWPNECVAEIAAANATCVAGNHDLTVVDRLPDARMSNHARLILEWTRTVLDPDSLAYLRALPLQVNVEPAIRLAHGSLQDPERYIFRDEDAAQQLKLLGELHPEAQSLILGHTHGEMAYGRRTQAHRVNPGTPMSLAGDKHLLNPGSVGQSRERKPWARLALLDTGNQQITFFALDYDVELCRRELIRHGLPPGACHVPPSLITLGRRFARRVAHRSLRQMRRR
ncbi:MAG: metallophosphoesterase family protein, partial [Actinomycetota bacterium]|nr:metallophosphoesterase family protein [Actinomycetota bacterium]